MTTPPIDGALKALMRIRPAAPPPPPAARAEYVEVSA